MRTAGDASNLVKRILTRELSTIEDDPEFVAALDAINRLQQPIFERVGREIERTLKEFLPDVRTVDIRPSIERRAYGLRSEFDVIVDDGTATPLKFKGDGVQSIAALSLRRAATTTRAGTKDLLLLVEEPEAHLHPGAAQASRDSQRISRSPSQIVMTTHNPVFVDRHRAANNVIVEGNRARVAQSIDEICEQLGVQASDNLRHAELVLLVEGETDRVAVRSLLHASSPSLAEALGSGRLTVDAAGGADRISYHASLIKSALCDVHVLLDYDAAGREQQRAAQARAILLPSEISFYRAAATAKQRLRTLPGSAVRARDSRTLLGSPCLQLHSTDPAGSGLSDGRCVLRSGP